MREIKTHFLIKNTKELIGNAISGKEKLGVIIDDYGIQRGLKSFLDRLRSEGNTVIVETKADEKYAVCQAASARCKKRKIRRDTKYQ